MAEQQPSINDYHFLGVNVGELFYQRLDRSIERVLALDPDNIRSQAVIQILPLTFLLPKTFLPDHVHQRILVNSPYLRGLQAEFSPKEARALIKSFFDADSLNPDIAGIGFSVSLVLDYLSRHPDKAADYLPPQSSLNQNIEYLRKRTVVEGNPEPVIDDPDIRQDIPVKVWAGMQLIKAGLADPETRYCIDPFSLAIRAAELLSRGRIVWISSCMPKDFADFVYTGLRRHEKEPAYQPQPGSLERIFYELIRKVKQRRHDLFPSILQDLDREELVSKLEHGNFEPWHVELIRTATEEEYQKQVSYLKSFHPQLFPKNNSAPLFRDINSLRLFYLTVLPQLLDISAQYPQTVFKVYPQDEKHLSIANISCDLMGRPNKPGDLGPSFTFEMSSGQYTPRGKVEVDRRAAYYPKYNLLVGDPESIKIFYQIVKKPMRDGGSFVQRLHDLFHNTKVHAGTVEIMVENHPENDHYNVAFATDFNPEQNPSLAPLPLNSSFAKLDEAIVINTDLTAEHQNIANILNKLYQDYEQDQFGQQFLAGLQARLEAKGLIPAGYNPKIAIQRAIAKDLETLQRQMAEIEDERNRSLALEDGIPDYRVPYSQRPRHFRHRVAIEAKYQRLREKILTSFRYRYPTIEEVLSLF